MMDKDKRERYEKAFLDAYNNDVFKIIWGTSSCSLNLDPEKKEMLPEIEEEEFVNYAFSVIATLADLAENGESSQKKQDVLHIAETIFEQEPELKDHICVKKNSKMSCFKLLDYEIISRRGRGNPIDINSTSAIIQIVTEERADETTYVFEVSQKDLGSIIDDLVRLKEKISIIESRSGDI